MSQSLGSIVAKLVLNITEFEANLRRVNGDLDDLLSENADRATQISNTLSSIGAMLTTTVTAPIVGVGQDIIETTATFEEKMSKVKAISGAVGEDLNKLKDYAMEMGATTKFSASESADALTYMAMAGWDTQQMLDGLKGIMDLAAADGLDLATTSDIVTDAITAFGLSAKDSGHFADVLATASSSANTNVSMLGESFKYVAPVAGAMKYSVEDVSLALGLMANASIKGSQSGTALRMIFNNLTDDVKFLNDETGNLTVTTKNADGTMRPLKDVMIDLRNSFNQLSDAEKVVNAQNIAGTEAMSGLLAIVNASDSDFNKLTENIYNAEGATKTMAETMSDNANGALEELGGALETLKLQFGEILVPIFTDIVRWVTNLVSALGELDESTRKVIIVMGLIATAMGPIILLIGKVIGAVQQIKAMIPVIQGLGTKIVTFFAGLSKSALIATGVVGAIIGVFIYLIATSEKFRKALGDAWDHVKNAISNAWEKIKPGLENLKNAFGNLLKALEPLMEVLGVIAVAFTGVVVGTLNGLLNALAPIIDAIGNIINFVSEIISALISLLTGDFDAAIQHLGNAGQEIINLFENILKAIEEYINGYIEGFIATIDTALATIGLSLEEVQLFFKELWSELKEWFLALWDDITTGFKETWEGVKNWFSNLWNDITDTLGNVWDNINEGVTGTKDYFVEKWTDITNFFDNLGTSINNAWSNTWTNIKNSCGETKQWFIDKWNGLVEYFTELWNNVEQVFVNTWGEISSYLSEIWNTISETVGPIWNSIAQLFTDVFNNIEEGIRESWNTITTFLKDTWTNIKDSVEGIWNGLTTFFEGLWETIKNIFLGSILALLDIVIGDFEQLKSDLENIWNNITNGLSQMWEGIKETCVSIFDGIATHINNTWELIKNNVIIAWQTIQNTITTLITDIKNLIITTWETISTKVIEIVQSIRDFIVNTWDNIKNTISETIETIKNTISNAWDTIHNKISETITNIENTLAITWESIKTTISDTLNSIKTTISNVWESITTTIRDICNQIKNVILEVWDTLKNEVPKKINQIKNSAISVFTNMVNSIRSKCSEIKNAIVNGFNSAIQWIANLPQQATTWGKHMIQGFIDGVTSKLSALKDKVKGVAQSIRNVLGFSIPKEGPLHTYMTWMPHMIEGMKSSLSSATPKLIRQVQQVAEGINVGINSDLNKMALDMNVSNIPRVNNTINTPKPVDYSKKLDDIVTKLNKIMDMKTEYNFNIETLEANNQNDVRKMAEELEALRRRNLL